MTVPWYLMTSYAYYVEDNPLVSDGAFDRLAKTMIKNWDKIEHFHNCLLYTSDAADDTPCVDLGGRRIIKKNEKNVN